MTMKKKRNISGPRIREARERLGHFQTDMPKMLRPHGWIISERAYAFIETGERQVTDRQLDILATVLGVTSDHLLGREGRQ